MGLISLRVEFRAVKTALNELRQAIQQHSESVHATQEAQQHANRPRNPMPVVVSYDDKTVEYTKTQDDREYRTQNSIKNWTKAAVIAASIYAAIAAFQAFLMWTNTDQLRRQIDDFEASQSAVLVMKDYRVVGPLEAGKPLHLECTILNTGATAAREVVVEDGNASGNAAPWFHTFGNPHSGFRQFDLRLPPIATPKPSKIGEAVGPNQTRDCSRNIGPLDRRSEGRTSERPAR